MASPRIVSSVWSLSFFGFSADFMHFVLESSLYVLPHKKSRENRVLPSNESPYYTRKKGLSYDSPSRQPILYFIFLGFGRENQVFLSFVTVIDECLILGNIFECIVDIAVFLVSVAYFLTNLCNLGYGNLLIEVD